MKILTHIGISALSTIFLYIAYLSGSIIAAYFGYPQRGGFGWDISVFTASFFMLPSALLASWLLNKLKIYPMLAAIIGFASFVLLSSLYLGNQFTGSGWTHPYRFIYFQLCALTVFSLLLAVKLTKPSN